MASFWLCLCRFWVVRIVSRFLLVLIWWIVIVGCANCSSCPVRVCWVGLCFSLGCSEFPLCGLRAAVCWVGLGFELYSVGFPALGFDCLLCFYLLGCSAFWSFFAHSFCFVWLVSVVACLFAFGLVVVWFSLLGCFRLVVALGWMVCGCFSGGQWRISGWMK